MNIKQDKGKVLHICPDFPNTKLYNLLITQLEGCRQNTVYVPSTKKDITTTFPVVYLEKDFGLLDRLLFYRKQHIIQRDIESRGLCDGLSLIHAHNLFSAGFTARKLSKKYGIPYVVAVRNTDVNDFFHYMIHLRHVGVEIMKDAAAVVFISPAYYKNVLETYVPDKIRNDIVKKCHVIPNGIDELFLHNIPRESKSLIEDKVIRLIYVGEINENKNISSTIKACEMLESRGYVPSLTVVGPIIESQCEVIKNNRFVKYHPNSPKEKVMEILRTCDIFVMPSIKETFGLVYVEAMSQGLPIIYSEGQGIDGYYEEGQVGFHVKSTSVGDIVNAIIKIRNDYGEMSDRCKRAAKSFSWSDISNIYLNLYQSVGDVN